jgi:hypothetical protein
VATVPLRRKFEKVLKAAQLCAAAKLHTPSLILSYSVIDAAAAICAEHPGGNIREYYTAWLDRYLLGDAKIECSAIDLWGARCGIVHTLSNESKHSRRGEARKVIYVNRGGDRTPLEGLERIRTAKSREEARGGPQPSVGRRQAGDVIVEIDSLLEAVRKGISSIFQDAESDPILANRIHQREARSLRLYQMRKDVSCWHGVRRCLRSLMPRKGNFLISRIPAIAHLVRPQLGFSCVA